MGGSVLAFKVERRGLMKLGVAVSCGASTVKVYVVGLTLKNTVEVYIDVVGFTVRNTRGRNVP